MHEWALAEAVVATVEKIRRENGGRPVLAVRLRFGELQNVDLEAFREGLAAGLGGLPYGPEVFRFLSEPAAFRCRACGRLWPLDRVRRHRGGGAGGDPLPAGKRARLPALPRLRQPGFRAGRRPGGLDRIGGAGRVIDPRPEVIGRRLAPVRRILAFSSAKGGVGKSVCSVLSALALRRAGCRVGLLDLDFQGASAHLAAGRRAAVPGGAGGHPAAAGARIPGLHELRGFLPRERRAPAGRRGLGGPAGAAGRDDLGAPGFPDRWTCRPASGTSCWTCCACCPDRSSWSWPRPRPWRCRWWSASLALLEELRLPVRGVIENMARAGMAGSAGAGVAAAAGAPSPAPAGLRPLPARDRGPAGLLRPPGRRPGGAVSSGLPAA